jgi:hypothetical protein
MALNTNQSINLFHQDMLLDLMKYVPPTKLHCYVKVAPLLEGHTFCDWLVFNAILRNISAILWHEQIL